MTLCKERKYTTHKGTGTAPQHSVHCNVHMLNNTARRSPTAAAESQHTSHNGVAGKQKTKQGNGQAAAEVHSLGLCRSTQLAASTPLKQHPSQRVPVAPCRPQKARNQPPTPVGS